MKTLLCALSLSGAIALFGGCAITGATGGFVYTNTTPPITATSTAGATKEGRATCTNILGIVAYGDCSVDTAAKAGNISQIRSVDYNDWSILSLFATTTTIVKGN